MLNINNLFEKGLPFDGHYKLLDLLSTAGGSADVWLALDLNTVDDSGDESKATKVVIKIYRPKNLIDIDGEYQFRKEFKKVFGCHHENIIQPTYFSIFEDAPYLVLPYCPAGSSELLIGQLTAPEDLWKYIFEVASGLAYLHEHSPRIVHQDIKPANVLIDDNGNYAITDFGISAEMGGADIEAEDETGGTFAYMAPERFIDGTPPMPESDIWALGATLYELITGDAPYGNEGGSVQTKDSHIPPIKQKLPEDIKNLIYSCLSFDPQARPSARRIADTLLKKRYARNKKTIGIIAICVLGIAVGATFFFTRKHATDPNAHLTFLYTSADSIIHSQLRVIEQGEGIPTDVNVTAFREAQVLMHKILNDASDSFDKKQEADAKVRAIDEILLLKEEYDFTDQLVENAQLTEMEDSVVKYSLVRDNIQIKLNELTQQLK